LNSSRGLHVPVCLSHGGHAVCWFLSCSLLSVGFAASTVLTVRLDVHLHMVQGRI